MCVFSIYLVLLVFHLEVRYLCELCVSVISLVHLLISIVHQSTALSRFFDTSMCVSVFGLCPTWTPYRLQYVTAVSRLYWTDALQFFSVYCLVQLDFVSIYSFDLKYNNNNYTVHVRFYKYVEAAWVSLLIASLFSLPSRLLV